MNTTIAIDGRTREELKMLGRKGETYDRILLRLIEIAKIHGFLEEQKRILNEEEFYPLDG